MPSALALQVLALRWRAALAATASGLYGWRARVRVWQQYSAERVAGRPAPRLEALCAVKTQETEEVSRYRNKVSYPEYIGCKKRTQGTETSKYLQERTSTETPQVVASERGPGQWQL